MPVKPIHSPLLAVAALGAVLAACSSQKQPAHQMLVDIQAAVSSASADAAQFVPDQLTEVQKKLGDLKGSYDKQDYQAVVNGGPPVLSEAQSLESAATAKKDQLAKSLNQQWTALTGALPGDQDAIQSRITYLSKPANRKLASGVDLEAAKSGLSEATTLWSAAQAAFAGGHVAQAVATGNEVKSKFEALAASMKLDFKQPAAVQDTSPG